MLRCCFAYFVRTYGICRGAVYTRAKIYKESLLFKCNFPPFRFIRAANFKTKVFSTRFPSFYKWRSYSRSLFAGPLIGSTWFLCRAAPGNDKTDSNVTSLLDCDQEKLEDGSVFLSSEEKTAKPRNNSVILSGLVFEIGLGLTGSLCAWKLGVPIFGKGFHISPTTFLQGALASVPLLGFVYLLEQLPFRWLKETASQTQRIIAEVFLHRSCAEIGLLCVCTGLAEEVAFRSFFYSWLVSRMHFSAPQGLIVSSVLFGLFHPVSSVYVYIASLAGSYFGFLYVITGNNVFVPAVAHAVYDYVILEISRYQLLQKKATFSNNEKLD